MKGIFIFLFVAAQSLLMANAPGSFDNVQPVKEKKIPDNLIIDLSLSGYASMTWTGTNTPGNYNVSVLNLTTSQLHTSFSTPNTWAVVSGLTTGNTYRFMVQKADFVIIVDVVG